MAPVSVTRNLSFKSPGPSSPTKSVKSPTKESSPFKYPELERRDSLFGDNQLVAGSKRDSLGLGISGLRPKTLSQETRQEDVETSRPSPVKFTSDPPLFHVDKPRYKIRRY